jgi:hypothetical protein
MLINKDKNYARVNRPRGDHFPSRYCFYDCVATYAARIGRNFELCFLSSWAFHYIADDNKDISQNLILSNDYLKDLTKHHGLVIQFHYQEKDNRSLLLEKLASNTFAIMKVDSYHVPWDMFYQKTHSVHYAIADRIDPASNELIVTDPYYDQVNVSFGVLDEAIAKMDGLSTVTHIPAASSNATEALVDCLKSRAALVNGKSSFQMIEDLAFDIDSLIHRQFELHEASQMDIGSDQLKNVLIDVYERRQDFAVLLDFYFSSRKKEKNAESAYFWEKMMKIINGWNVIQLIYVRAVISNRRNFTESMKDRILGMAEAERLLSEELIQFLDMSVTA